MLPRSWDQRNRGFLTPSESGAEKQAENGDGKSQEQLRNEKPSSLNEIILSRATNLTLLSARVP